MDEIEVFVFNLVVEIQVTVFLDMNLISCIWMKLWEMKTKKNAPVGQLLNVTLYMRYTEIKSWIFNTFIRKKPCWFFFQSISSPRRFLIQTKSSHLSNFHVHEYTVFDSSEMFRSSSPALLAYLWRIITDDRKTLPCIFTAAKYPTQRDSNSAAITTLNSSEIRPS